MHVKLANSSRLRAPHQRLVLLFGVLTLLLAVSGQMMAFQSADAQTNAALRLQDDQDGEETQPDQEVQPTFVVIDKYDCPTGSDWSQATYDQLAQGCPSNQNPVNISVNGESQSVGGSAQWGPYEGVTSFDISEEEREGYQPPHVVCGSYIPDVSQPDLQYLGATSFFNWQLQPGESLYCQIFNYQAGGEFATLLFHKFACPDSWDWQDPYAVSVEELAQVCTTPLSNVQFDYEQNGQIAGSLVTDQQGDALWDQAPAGEATIREVLPSGYAFSVVNCSYHPADSAENFAGNSQPVQMEDSSSFFWGVEAGFVLECYWFNFPADQIQLYKYWCPAEMAEPDGLALNDYQNACFEQPGDDISWLLRDLSTDQEITSLGPSGDLPGYAGYHELQQDQTVGITETIPSGYGPPIVFCYEFERGNPDGQLYTDAYDPQNGVTWTPQVDFYLVCYFFNVQAEVEEFGQIVIEKYWCPPGLAFVQAPTLADMQGACQDEGSGATFSLEGPEGDPQSWPPVSPEGGPPASGGWEEVPPGNYAIFETGLGEGWTYTVFCEESGETPVKTLSEPTLQELFNGNGVQWAIQAGLTLTCYWFNQPPEDGEENSVTVYKWDCAPGTESGRELEYYQGGLPDQETGPCETQHTNIPISLIDGDGEHPTTTQADGTEWDGVVLDPEGGFQIVEEIPEGYGDPMVFCGTLDDEAQQPVSATGGGITITPQSEPFTYQCNWYNIPIADYNYIDFYKFLCAPDALPDQDKTYYEENCESVEGWEFNVQWTDGGSTETTDASGHASWSGVPVGEWQGTETVPEGYGEPYIWCRYLEWPDEATVDGNWLGQGAPGGVYNGNFEFEGMRIECHWYNFGAPTEVADEPGDNWITIYKYLCAPETEASEELGVMQETCTETHSGVEFSLLGENETEPDVQSTVGGVVEWTDLEFGEYTITESVPPGYSPPLVWCGNTMQDGVELDEANQQYDPYTVTDGAIQADLNNTPQRIVCYWFNFPGEESTVTVYKYNCDFHPEGYQTLGQWQEACPAEGNDWTFTLTDSADNSTEMVTANGSASWTDVPEGAFTLAETPEEGWGEPVVWCGWTAYVDGAVFDAFPQQVETTSGEFVGEILYPGTTYFCYWFNIPVDDSTVTVIKYICPEGQLEGVVPNPLQTYLEMCTTPGNGIEFTLETTQGESSATTLDGVASWADVPQGDITITETLPPGYGPPIWFCTEVGILEAVTTEGFQSLVMNETEHTATIEHPGTRYVCWVFNFPDPDRTVEVFKWLCPEGYTGESYEDWSANCTMPIDGVKFTLTDENGSWPLNTVGGHATWYGVAQGDVTLDEHIPPGYFEPLIYCSLEAENEEVISEDFTEYPSTNGAISRTLEYDVYHWVCHVFDIPKGPAEITFYKWLCPPGYDFYAWGSDPTKDCDQLWDGVVFTLDQPAGPNLQSTTGDAGPGAVYFGDLDHGTYVATETVPPDIGYIFVLDCTGSDDDKVHPYPLQFGNNLTIEVAGGDSIVCNWYNVPEPENGWVTLYKYQCWTPTFTSTVNCEIYEHGATFELFDVPADDSFGVGTTNVGGLFTWYDLAEGAYDLDEISHKPCKITTTKHDGQGHIWVDAGQGTVVKVYNCKPKTPPPPGTPTVPGKPPVKYPNTGAGPAAAGVAASMAQATPEGTPEGTPEAAAEDYFLISCLDVPPGATPEATPETVDEAEPEPTPTPIGEEEEFDLPIDEEEEEEVATPDGGTPEPEEECIRGAIPERVVVDAAQVDAGVEILEIIDGVMEQPTGPELVTWYKETGRLGEDNNVVIAGHLNYWGVPQGVFFYLDQLREGDRVEVTGDDGKIYVFEVEWVRQESNLEPPAPDVIGPTDVPSLTLITCGGEWNAQISEYDERTVARAVQVEVLDPPEET